MKWVQPGLCLMALSILLYAEIANAKTNFFSANLNSLNTEQRALSHNKISEMQTSLRSSAFPALS